VTHDVLITPEAFIPSILSLEVGDTVRWTNGDAAGHIVMSATRAWDAVFLDQGDSVKFRIKNPGSLRYRCLLDPKMTGLIVANPGRHYDTLRQAYNRGSSSRLVRPRDL
jgi:plastocyanin